MTTTKPSDNYDNIANNNQENNNDITNNNNANETQSPLTVHRTLSKV